LSGVTAIVEAHLLDCDEDLYGQTLRLGFSERLRPERRFASVDTLVAQIQQDIAQTRKLLAARTGTK
jgi:riboflavin kinase/FMN adenylyltransferase